MVQLYTANHPITTGIEDLLKVIVLAGKSHDLNIEVSDSISSKVILFIDEFSSRSELKRLLWIKKEKNLRYVLISTEFETDNACGSSFNEFSRQTKYISIIVFIASLILYRTPKSCRNGKILGKVSAGIGALFILPVLFSLSNCGWDAIVDRVRALKRSIYMKARRRGYDEFKSSADLVIKIHERLDAANDYNVIYPALPKAARFTNENIKVSGTQTSYRIKMCDAFLKRLNEKNDHFFFDYDGTIKFDAQHKDKLYGFAYQPAQSDSWDKSNPIKIWRDCFLHGSLPIVDKKFDDHPIEAIAITTGEFFLKQFDQLSVLKKFLEYDQLVYANNQKIFQKIDFLQSNV